MNLNHNKNYLQHMTEDEYLDDKDFSVSKVSRKELKTKWENEDGNTVHNIKNGKTFRKN